MNGEESTAGIQFDITRLDPLLSGPKDNINIMVKDLNGETSNYFLSRFSRVETLKLLVKAKAGVDVAYQSLVSSSQQLKSMDYTLHQCQAPSKLTISQTS